MLSLSKLLVLSTASIATAGTVSGLSPTATLDAGVVVGTTTAFPSSSTTVNKFLGVPFAAPPKRFEPAGNPEPWTQPLDTKNASPACVQQFRYPEAFHNLSLSFLNNPAPEESEDCLYLNVYAPATPGPEKGRAVLFWIYGGGFWVGHAAFPTYDGSHFAAFEDVIVVAANYRTNIFGFPNSPNQQQNLGFLDQRLALDWVQRNIHAFGGDPSKVTIFGESAGAFSVDALITSYSSSPSNTTGYGTTALAPFRAAIMQSGQLSYRSTPNPGRLYPSGAPAWAALATALNCTSTNPTQEFSCIQRAPAPIIKDIIEKQSLVFSPVHDNQTLVSDLTARRRARNIAQVPILIGANKDEGTILAGLFFDDLNVYLNATFGERLTPALRTAIDKTYPVGSAAFPTVFEAISAIEGDISMLCGAGLVANDTAAIGVPAWRYLYTPTFPSTNFMAENGTGSYHTGEISMVFSTYPIPGQPHVKPTVQQDVLSNVMRGAWARFAKDPIAGPGWNAVGTGAEFYEGVADLDVGVFVEEGVRVWKSGEVDARCGIWNGVLRGE